LQGPVLGRIHEFFEGQEVIAAFHLALPDEMAEIPIKGVAYACNNS
jgi:hypothetical protein